jgi:hypothetical protein
MSRVLVTTVSVLLLLSGCNRQGSEAPSSGTADTATNASEASGSAATSGRKSNRLSREELDAIAGSGRRGVWTEPAEICKGTRGTAVVSWNVEESQADNVNVYLTKANGTERRFASGKTWGGKRTGTWARPGTTFVLKNAEDGAELGKVTIGGKDC